MFNTTYTNRYKNLGDILEKYNLKKRLNYNSSRLHVKSIRSKEISKEKAVNTDKKYVVTHKIYDISKFTSVEIQKSLTYKLGGFYGTRSLSDIVNITNNLMYMQVTDDKVPTVGNIFFKNPWIGLVFKDVINGNTFNLTREQILNSNIIGETYNAYYMNNGANVRVNYITDSMINKVNEKVREQQEKLNKQQEINKEKEKELEKLRIEVDKAVKTGDKIFKVLEALYNTPIPEVIKINNKVYFKYSDYTGDNYNDGLMVIVSEELNTLRLLGYFLDKRDSYSLDYQYYATIEASSETVDDIINNINRASDIDDLGYMNTYTISTHTKTYEIDMYLDEYDGQFKCNKLSNKPLMDLDSIKSIKDLGIKIDKSTLNVIDLVLKTVDEYKDTNDIKGNNSLLKALVTYGDDKSRLNDVVSMLFDNSLYEKLYYIKLFNSLLGK